MITAESILNYFGIRGWLLRDQSALKASRLDPVDALRSE